MTIDSAKPRRIIQKVAAEIFERSGIAIPECGYIHMESLGAFRSYLSERLAEPGG